MRLTIHIAACLLTVLVCQDTWAQDAQIEKLINDLSSNDREVRLNAVDALAAAGDSAIGPLTKALTSENTQVRAYSAFALGRIGKGSDAVLEGLVAAAFDKDVLVRRAAGRALQSINAPPEKTLPLVIRILEEAEPDAIVPALHTLAEQGAAVVPRLREALKHPKAAYWACLVLGEIGPDAAPAVPELRQLMASVDPDMRLQALLALGEIGPAASAATPEIIQALQNDQFDQVRLAAAYSLAKIDADGDSDDAALKKQLQTDDPFLQLMSAWALARMNPEDEAATSQALKYVVAGLKSDDDHLQSAAARALADLDLESIHEAAATALMEALGDEDPHVAANALDALTDLGPQAAAKAASALNNKVVRNLALRVLYRLGPEAAPAVPALVKALASEATNDGDREFQREARITLAQVGPEAKAAVPVLVESLNSPEIEIAGSSAYALGKIGPAAREAVPKLVELTRSGDEQRQRVAVWALLKIVPGDERLAKMAVPLLIGGLRSERDLVRAEAAVALGEIGAAAKDAVPSLQKLLEDPSPAVREAAAGAIKKLQ